MERDVLRQLSVFLKILRLPGQPETYRKKTKNANTAAKKGFHYAFVLRLEEVITPFRASPPLSAERGELGGMKRLKFGSFDSCVSCHVIDHG